MTVVEGYHCNNAGGSHFGIENTLKRISEKYWWKGMKDDVSDFVSKCDSCQRANFSKKPSKSELHPVPVSRRLFHRWGIDICGPFKTCDGGNRYVIVATEYLTRWPEVGVLKRKTAAILLNSC